MHLTGIYFSGYRFGQHSIRPSWLCSVFVGAKLQHLHTYPRSMLAYLTQPHPAVLGWCEPCPVLAAQLSIKHSPAAGAYLDMILKSSCTSTLSPSLRVTDINPHHHPSPRPFATDSSLFKTTTRLILPCYSHPLPSKCLLPAVSFRLRLI